MAICKRSIQMISVNRKGSKNMRGLYGFLKFLENAPANYTNICNYQQGKSFFDYCIQYGLITSKNENGNEKSKNTVGETLYRLTDKATVLIKSKNFNECLKQIESEVKK